MSISNGYTASLAYDVDRRRLRKVPGLMTSSPLADAAMGYFSLLTLVMILSYLIVFMILLVPMVVCAKIFGKRNWFSSRNDGSSTNVSTHDVGSITAIKTLSCRSQMSIQNSGGPDHLAPLLMGRMSLLGDGIPGTRFFSQGYLWLNRLNFYLTRRIFGDQIAQWINIIPFGETPFFHARTCWLDDCVEEFLRRHAKNPANVVILGAGYDTRCYRLLMEGSVHAFEVDTAATQSCKRRLLAKAGIDSKYTQFVPCDFLTQDWLEQLESCGFDKALPTLFIWEGVTYYLPRTTVEDTLTKIATCGEGTRVAFDYFDSTWLMTPTIQKITEKCGEKLIFGLAGDEPVELVESKGMDVVEHLKHKELVKRYVPTHFDGRPIGWLNDFGGFVLAGII